MHHYPWQDEMLRQVLGQPDGLRQLTALMRQSPEEAGLGRSVIWLVGPQWSPNPDEEPGVDHPFQLVSSEIGLALSFLPQDEPKCAKPAYHPTQTEIMIALEGPVVVRTEINSALFEEGSWSPVITLDPNEDKVLVIPPGVCHAVTSLNGKPATHVFLKTDMGAEPEKVSCEGCAIHPSEDEQRNCRLRRWHLDID